VLVALWVTAPLIAVRVLDPAARALGPALVDVEVSRGLVVGLAAPAAALGAALALSTVGPSTLGPQVAASPVGRRALAVAALLPSLGVTTVLVAPVALAVSLSLVAHSAAGRPGCLPLSLVLGAAVACGAVMAESALRCVRRRRALPLIAIAAGGAVLVVLLELLARALTGGDLVALLAVGASAAVVGLAAVGAWVELLSSRPDRRSRRTTRATCVPSRAGLAALRLATAVLVRRPDVRLAVVAGAGLGVAGTVAGTAMRQGAGAAALLGGGSAVVAAALAPLSAGGCITRAAWAWRVAGRCAGALGWSAASGALVGASVLPVVVLGLGLGAPPALLLLLGMAATLGWSAALVVGAALPRHEGDAAGDAAALALLGTLATALAGALSAAQSALEELGVPGTLAATAVLSIVSILGAGALAAASPGRR
jgi:hypothetical protein